MFRRGLVLVAVPMLVGALCGCGGSHTTAASGEDGRSARGSVVTVRNCGREVRVQGRPQRAVTADQSSTEALLALGLEGRIAGVSNMKMTVPQQYQAAYAKVPVLSPNILSAEQTLAARPDIVVSGYGSMFAKDRYGTREDLARRGVATYLWENECPKGQPGVSDPVEAAYLDERNLGRIFGVPERAEALVKEQKAEIARSTVLRPTGAPPKIVWLYSAYDGLPYVAGKGGMPSALSRLLNAKNVFDDVDEHWPEVQWEQVAARDPDIIVLADLSGRGRRGDTPADKIKALKENPATARLAAVQQNRFVTVPGPALDASVRFPEALKLVGEDLRKRGLLA